jgi:pyocin large subunit-like protein
MTVRSISTPAILLLGTLSLALSLAGCERPSAVRADGAAASAAADTAYSPAAPADTSERNNRYDGGRSGERAEAPAPLLDGRPLWTSSRRGSAEENAQRAFARNGESFGASSLEAYVRKARTFIDDPPQGAQRLTRRNGDVLIYHPGSNTFAVASREGQPRAFFHPDQGGAYWETQKARETQARSARAGSDRASEG